MPSFCATSQIWKVSSVLPPEELLPLLPLQPASISTALIAAAAFTKCLREIFIFFSSKVMIPKCGLRMVLHRPGHFFCFCQLLQKQRENFVNCHIAQFLFPCCTIIITFASGLVNAKMLLVISQFEGILRIVLKSSRILVYNKKKRTGGVLYAGRYKKKRVNGNKIKVPCVSG